MDDQGIGCKVDFGRHTTSGAPQSLIPPFEPLPVAACWCARTRLLSSETELLSGSSIRCSNTRSHTPASARRMKTHETFVHGLPFAIALRQVVPARARSQDPQNTIHKEAVIGSTPPGIASFTRQKRFDFTPLRRAEFVSLGHVIASRLLSLVLYESHEPTFCES